MENSLSWSTNSEGLYHCHIVCDDGEVIAQCGVRHRLSGAAIDHADWLSRHEHPDVVPPMLAARERGHRNWKLDSRL